jgi:hypothetical protein
LPTYQRLSPHGWRILLSPSGVPDGEVGDSVTVSVSVRVSVTVLVLALDVVVVVVSDGVVVVVVVGSVVVVVVAVPVWVSITLAGGATATEVVVAELDGGVVTVSDLDESSAITRMIPYTAKARTTTATAPTAIIAAGF